MRPVIVLYTNGAEIAPETLDAMRAAGYLPVKVNDANAIRILDIPAAAFGDDLSLVQRAALEALLKSTEGTLAYTSKFGASLAQMLLGQRKP